MTSPPRSITWDCEIMNMKLNELSLPIPPRVLDLSARLTLSADDFRAAVHTFRAQYNGWLPVRILVSQTGYASLVDSIHVEFPGYLFDPTQPMLTRKLERFQDIEIRVIDIAPAGNGPGAIWLARQGVKMSNFGCRVADLVNELYRGIYHIGNEVCRADWSSDGFISIVVPDPLLATYDNDMLTRLVILAHDRNIRASIRASSPRYLRLEFMAVTRSGFFADRHPTLSEGLKKLRGEI